MIGTNKLTTEKVEDIRQMISDGMTDQSIAHIFNVSRSNINLIRNNKRWNYDENSFLMKEQIKDEPSIQNYLIVSVMKENRVVDTYNITIDKLNEYSEYIESSFLNNTGGWTIRIVINI